MKLLSWTVIKKSLQSFSLLLSNKKLFNCKVRRMSRVSSMRGNLLRDQLSMASVGLLFSCFHLIRCKWFLYDLATNFFTICYTIFVPFFDDLCTIFTKLFSLTGSQREPSFFRIFNFYFRKNQTVDPSTNRWTSVFA